MTAPTARQAELARRRAYETAREKREFVADLQAELEAARLTMLREGWF